MTDETIVDPPVEAIVEDPAVEVVEAPPSKEVPAWALTRDSDRQAAIRAEAQKQRFYEAEDWDIA